MGGAETERCQEEDHFTRLNSDPSGSPGSGRSRKLVQQQNSGGTSEGSGRGADDG